MRHPAFALLVLAVAASAAAASERFRPDEPGFVVANVRESMPDAELSRLLAQWRADPGSAPTIALASAFLDRAHTLREPKFVGRAEAVLAAAMRRGDAAPVARRLYAQTLQYRHDFDGATRLLDGLLGENPRDLAARTLRASVRLAHGDFGGARADCARLATGGGQAATVGVACLAAALAGGGQLPRGLALLAAYPLEDSDPASAAYLLAVRGELRERGDDPRGALADYRAALARDPHDDSVRAALAEMLGASGARAAARQLVDVERASLALLMRHALLEQGARREALLKRAAERLALETARGDNLHWREAALLALDGQADAPRALAAAQRNFELQREVADVRVLARCVVAARDAAAGDRLRDWLRTNGYRDVVTERILADILRRSPAG